MVPGIYQLFRFRPIDDNCSVALKDTLIILDAPNDLIGLSITSNSPICENETLKLQSTMNVKGNIKWSGPDFFVTENPNPEIVNVNEKI